MGFRPVAGSGGDGKNVMQWTTVGQTITGRLIGCKNGKVFAGRQSRLAILDIGNGVQQAVPLTSDLADDKQFEAVVKPGNIVKITLIELVKTKQPQPYKKFELLIDDGTEGPQQANAPTVPAGGRPSTDDLEKALIAKVGEAQGRVMVNALKQLYSAKPEEYAQNLYTTAKAQGAAA